MLRSNADYLTAQIAKILAYLAGIVVFLVFGFVCLEAVSALGAIGWSQFVTDDMWLPTADKFYLLSMLAATIVSTIGAIIIATPLGIGCALFSRHWATPGVAMWFRRLVELLAGIPSVVYGLWGLVVLVPLLAEFRSPGSSLLAGILVLAVMILPTVALLADTAIGAVPVTYIRGVAALGVGKFTTMMRIVLPTARAGIATGVLLATGRALGETMAVLMVCGNVIQMPFELLDPVRTLTANIALEMGYATAFHRSALFVCGLVLMLLVGALVLIAQESTVNEQTQAG
ncbi:MAG: phosphate ABC transporter permease subunit PstC [Gammaproteobacteria bacterium]|nr:phosphate ABC transporter permease subunit PstC [Gammaproteobacteria bacterium]